MIIAYESLCPSCRGDIDSHRLGMGLPCRSCLHSIPGDGEVEGDPLARARALAKILGGSSGDYGYIAAQEEELGEFSAFFKRLTGLICGLSRGLGLEGFYLDPALCSQHRQVVGNQLLFRLTQYTWPPGVIEYI